MIDRNEDNLSPLPQMVVAILATFALAVLAIVLSDCKPAPVAPPPLADAAPYDAGPTAPECADGCARLRALACPEGSMDCEAVCTHAWVSGVVALQPSCWAQAADKEAARACGDLDCE